MVEFRNIQVHFKGEALAELDRIAAERDLTYTAAARELIDRALAKPADANRHADGSRECRPLVEGPQPLPIESIALDALLAEVKRRADSAANDEALGDAVARYEAAEAKLAQLRAALA